MTIFTARESNVPGKTIVYAGASPAGLMAPDLCGRVPAGPMLTTITVVRWEGLGDGTARLLARRSGRNAPVQHFGVYGPDDKFADTSGEALALWEAERRSR